MDVSRIGRTTVVVMAICAAAAGIACKQPVTPDAGDLSAAELLAAYGIVYNLGNPVDPRTGETAADDYNPFGRGYAKLHAKRELYFTGMRQTDSAALSLFDDHDYATGIPMLPLASGAAAVPAFDGKPHGSVAADVDGDGRDEVVTLYYTGAVSPGKNVGKAYLHVVGKDDAVVASQPVAGGVNFTVGIHATHTTQMSIAIAAGDVDADGKSELGVIVGSTFAVLDDASHGYATLAGPVDLRGSDKYDAPWTNTYWMTEAASGDLDGDGCDEFVVACGIWTESYPYGAASSPYAKYYVFGASSTPKASGDLIDGDGKYIFYGNVAVGDLDGDGLDEAAFSGCRDRTGGSYNFNVLAAEWKDGGLSLPGGGMSLAITDTTTNHYRPGASVFWKPVAQGKSYLAAINRIIEYDTDTAKLEVECALPAAVWGQCEQAFAAGDINSDGADELVCLDFISKRVYMYRYNTATKVYYTDILYGSTSYAYGAGIDGVYYSLCMPDWDGDSVYMRYLRRELAFTSPDVIAVLASPPYWADNPGASFGNCATTFGTTEGSSYGNEHSFNVTVSGKVGAGVSAFDLISVEETYGSALAYTGVTAYSVQKSTSQSYSTVAGEDLVIIASTPVDLYYYEIIRSGDSSEVGKEMVLSMPRTPQTIPMELQAFNELADESTRIDAAFVGHTIGNPKTYLTKVEMLAAADDDASLVDTKGVSVGFNSSYATSEATVDVESSSSHSGAATISHSFKAAILISVESEQSFTYEYTHTTSTSDGTFIAGSSPGLPVGSASEMNYTFGVAYYPKVLEATEDALLFVTYWVDTN